MNSCPRCGSWVDEGDSFCRNCGGAVAGQPTASFTYPRPGAVEWVFLLCALLLFALLAVAFVRVVVGDGSGRKPESDLFEVGRPFPYGFAPPCSR